MTAAITNERMTAGPADGTALFSTKKMPVPMVAPMPIADSCQSPIERRRWMPERPPSSGAPAGGPSRPSLSAIRVETGLRLRRRAPSVLGAKAGVSF